jgi:signal transduction histidine kinase
VSAVLPHRSVFARLVAVMLAVAFTVLSIVAWLFFRVIGPDIGGTFHRVAHEYAALVAATAPGERRANELAKALDIEIRYEGPGAAWTTSPRLRSIAEVEGRRSGGGPRAWDYTIAPSPDGGRYLFAWGHYRRMRAAHDKLLWLALGLVLAIIAVGYEAIRRSLRPLRALHAAVSRLGDGDLDVVVPVTSKDELGALTVTFNGMVRRVREMVTARDRLLLDVSHELRSPLTRMKVALALLPEGDKRTRMEADVAEMETLISELLELERLRDGRALELTRRDLAPILTSAAEAFQDVPPGVLLDEPREPLFARVDADKVKTVLKNLLENAAKYALPDSAPVALSGGREGASVVIRVRDDGPGIPEADRAALFEPFFRVDRSRSKKTGGYGLGLSICKRIMEAHGGDISLESGKGRGVTFVLRFPAA